MNWMESNLQTRVPSGTDNVWPSSYGRLQPVNGRVVMHILTNCHSIKYNYIYVLLCLVCLFDLACFFLSSFSSLI